MVEIPNMLVPLGHMQVLLGKPLFPGRNVVHQLELITDLLGSPSAEVINKVRTFHTGSRGRPAQWCVVRQALRLGTSRTHFHITSRTHKPTHEKQPIELSVEKFIPRHVLSSVQVVELVQEVHRCQCFSCSGLFGHPHMKSSIAVSLSLLIQGPHASSLAPRHRHARPALPIPLGTEIWFEWAVTALVSVWVRAGTERKSPPLPHQHATEAWGAFRAALPPRRQGGPAPASQAPSLRPSRQTDVRGGAGRPILCR